jgi:recombinational DNA repair protein (RecF pathway)
MTAKIISIETKRCCDCGKSLEKSEQFVLNEKQIVCSSCWNTREKQASGGAQ